MIQINIFIFLGCLFLIPIITVILIALMSVSRSNELSNLYDYQKSITNKFINEFLNELEYMNSNGEITYDVYSRLFDIIDRFEL